MVLDGKISKAIQTVTNTTPGGLFLSTDIDQKSGLPVIDMLRHPPISVPSDADFDMHDQTEELLESMLV